MNVAKGARRRTCLIGAGFISHLHAEALRNLPGAEVTAVIDPNEGAARRLAERWTIPAVHGSLDEALDAGDIDAVHVLTPPDHHEAVTRKALEAGLPVLVEKPLTPAGGSSDALVALARDRGLTLGVNQNFVFHPAFQRLKTLIESGALGCLNNLTCLYRMPLRQLKGRQFGHWMFQAPQNLLLEQAVHPLSQVRTLVPDAGLVNVATGERLTLGTGKALLLEVDVMLRGQTAPVQFHFALGADFPHWELIASCTDGIAHADIVNNRCYTRRQTRWLEPTDQLLSGVRSAAELASGAVANAIGYGLSMVRIQPRSDAFYLSMKRSVAEFHHALDRRQQPISDGRFATGLIDLCEQIAEAGGSIVRPAPAARESKAPAIASSPTAREHDLLVIGGTGFIGRAVMRAVAVDDRQIAVLARNTTNLAPDFSRPNVSVIRGSFTDPAAIDRAMTGCRQVVHLAHGMGSGGDVIETMRAGTRLIAEKSLAHGIERLVYISSIAALYLGNADETITAATPPDQDESRADYSRAKAFCDLDLLALHRDRNLPVVILRPGLVVGEGTSPFHGGLGFYNNEQHCMGWSDGRHPLPFVLVEDVADAILKALDAERVEGKCYNIVGDVRPDARRYIQSLAEAAGRPLCYHSQSVNRLYAVDCAKWVLKRLGGRRVPPPSRRDLRSRGLFARFDCTAEKRDLNWQPIADETMFTQRAIDIFRPRPPAGAGEVVVLPAKEAAAVDERQAQSAARS